MSTAPARGATAPTRDGDAFAGQVRTMFDRIAGVYDAMNAVMTAGLHHRWRARAADWSGVGPADRALDACCGTGDLALELAGRVGAAGEVVGVDFSEAMLERARAKARERGLGNVRWEQGDAMELAYADASFDAVTVGFGVRNLADVGAGLTELARVLRPGGRLVVLEITRPRRPPLSGFYSLWFDRLVPQLGRLAGDPAAYRYLPESVRSYPEPEGVAALLEQAGLTQVRYAILAGGIITLHRGVRPG